MLISPTEPAELRSAYTTSSVPERYGVDIFWPSKMGLCGVQRKEVKDLVNSIHDGRLNKELAMMNQLDVKILLIEGNMKWTTEGQSLVVQSWSLKQHLGVMLSAQLSGCWSLTSDSLQETIALISSLRDWTNKEDHGSLNHRPNPVSQWGQVTNKDWGIWLLQSFPSIGWKLAGEIFDHFGGVPLQWTVTEEEFNDVPGIGPGRSRSLMAVLERAEPDEEDQESDDGYANLLDL